LIANEKRIGIFSEDFGAMIKAREAEASAYDPYNRG